MTLGFWIEIYVVNVFIYKLWYLDSDIEYEIRVLFIRFGEGGIGFLGFSLIIRIKCVGKIGQQVVLFGEGIQYKMYNIRIILKVLIFVI